MYIKALDKSITLIVGLNTGQLVKAWFTDIGLGRVFWSFDQVLARLQRLTFNTSCVRTYLSLCPTQLRLFALSSNFAVESGSSSSGDRSFGYTR